MTLARMFEAAKARREMALIPYVTAGYPSLRASLDFIVQAADAGADAIEIGLPFSDPTADGPTIQFASHHALESGFKTRAFLEALVTTKRACPLILMTYVNPLLALGTHAFSMIAKAGFSAAVIPDLAEEEAASTSAVAAGAGVDLVLLVAPTSSPERLRRIGSRTRGFVYAVSVVGTTGARRDADPALPGFLTRIREHTPQPVVAGFGLSHPSHIEAINEYADGAIVGSRLVDAIRHGEDFAALIRSFKHATRRH